MESRATFVEFLYAVTVSAIFSKIGSVGFGLEFAALCLLILVILEDYYLYSTQVLPTEQKELKTKFIVLVLEASILLSWYLSAVSIGQSNTVFLVTFSLFSLLKITAGLFHWLSHPDKINWRFFRYVVFIFVPVVSIWSYLTLKDQGIIYLTVFFAWLAQAALWWGITHILIEREDLSNTLQPRPKHTETTNKIRLVAFDLDGTLIKGIRYSWSIVWNHLNVDNQALEQRKEQFRKKELSYLEWCRLDSEAFKKHGLNNNHFKEIVKSHSLELTKNLREGLLELKNSGIKIAIISGGIDALLYELLPDADELFDEIFINRFIFSDDGRLKKISATEYDWDDSKVGVVGKSRGLERLCEKYDISIDDAAFVGDDHNDIEAMKIAGLKIFYCEDNRESIDDDLPEETVIITENDLLKVVDRILHVPIE
jgi:HAD superfamily phosphoserine phosphatase-like hydrolase